MIGRAEALLILKKWADDSARLRFAADLTGAGCSFDCRILELSEEAVVLGMTEKRTDFFRLSLVGCSFEYGEPRTDEQRSEWVVDHTFAAVLVAFRPSRERFFFMEIVS